MSYLLETLGRGLLGRLLEAFQSQLPLLEQDTAARLEARLAQCPTSVDLRVRLGLSQLHEQRASDARQTLEKLLRDAPRCLPAVLGLACVNDELGIADQSVELLERAAEIDARDPAIAFALGLMHERRGERVEARRHYTQAARLCSRLRNAYERLAALDVRAADWTSAIEHYRTLVDLEPEELDLQLTLAALYLQAGFPEHAVDAFQRALLIEPECSDEALEGAEILANDGQLAQAIHAVQRLVDQYPGAAELHVHLADLLVKSGADADAVRHYRAALELHPGFVEATVKLGTQHLRAGRLVDAARLFNRAVELNDRLVTAFVGLGLAQHACGRGEEAEATLALAGSLEPNSGLLLAECTRLYMRSCDSGRRTSAERDELEALESDGGGNVLAEALRCHQRELILSPGRADLRYRCGMLLQQGGEPERALEEFRQAVAIDPTFTRGLLKYGLALRQAQQPDEGLRVLRNGLLLEPHQIPTHYQLALLFTEPARFHLALDRFQHVGREARSAFEHNLALALQNVGLVDRAAAMWRTMCETSRASLRTEDRVSNFMLASTEDGEG